MNSPDTNQSPIRTLQWRVMQAVVREAVKAAAPPPKLTVSEWADRYRILSAESGAAEPGQWKTSKAEYQRGIMDSLSDPRVYRVVIMSSAQVGKTEFLLNIIGYFIDQDPSPILVVQPRKTDAEQFSKDRIGPMLRESPRLKDKVSERTKGKKSDTILHKSFPGGYLIIANSRSPAALASKPARLVLCDETDRYPRSVGREGSPVKLAHKRATTFTHNKKLCDVSTPVIKGESVIEDGYDESDKRRFHVPCPHCAHFQHLEWKQLKWEPEKPSSAKYECISCKQLIDHSKKSWMLRRGTWIAEKPFNGIAGFHLNELYSPWSTWSKMASEWIEASRKAKNGDVEDLKTFVNTSLGQTWEDKGEAPEWRRLYERRERYDRNTLPAGVVFITAAADVQGNRIEVEIKGWGRNKENWSIDHRILMGDPAKEEVWKELEKILETSWVTATGVAIPILRFGIDSGFETQRVYDWVRKWPSDRVIALDGRDELLMPIGIPKAVDVNSKDGRTIRRGLMIHPVGTSHLKTEFYRWLRLDYPMDGQPFPGGYCHYPQYDRSWFEQLTAEQKVKVTKGGRLVSIWKKVGERNEALDLHVYNRGVAASLGIDQFTDQHWQKLEAQIGAVRAITPKQSAPAKSSRSSRPRSSYLGRR